MTVKEGARARSDTTELRCLQGNESVQNVNKRKQLNSLSPSLAASPSLSLSLCALSPQRARSIMSGNVSLKPGPRSRRHKYIRNILWESQGPAESPAHDNVESHFPFSLCQNSTKAANCTIYSPRLRVSPHSMDE